MRHSLPATAGLAVDYRANRPVQIRTARPDGRPEMPALAAQRYQVACLGSTLSVNTFSRLAPALPFFQNAFGAMAHGAVVATQQGPTAIEDLTPGTPVLTRDNGYQPVLWIGSTTAKATAKAANTPDGTIDIDHTSDVTPVALTRFTADSLGPARPGFDLVLGQAARLLHRHCDAGLTLVPAAVFCDGEQVIQTHTRAPIQLFHLAFARHQIIQVNGIDIESYHPGPNADVNLGSDLSKTFMGLFPNFRSFGSFGRQAYRRISARDMHGLRVG